LAAKDGTLKPGARSGGGVKGTPGRTREGPNADSGGDHEHDDREGGQREFERLVGEIEQRKTHVDTMRTLHPSPTSSAAALGLNFPLENLYFTPTALSLQCLSTSRLQLGRSHSLHPREHNVYVTSGLNAAQCYAYSHQAFCFTTPVLPS
jgi:hypothetical protein